MDYRTQTREARKSNGQFNKGHQLTPKGNRYWDNPKTKATWWKKGERPPYSHFKKGHTPWNKDKDFGGNELLSKRISWLALYRKWKKDVRCRDSSKCLWCGATYPLNVDHYPVSLAQLIKKYDIKTPQETKSYLEFWDINNGRTLCVSCHKKTETYGRNTR